MKFHQHRGRGDQKPPVNKDPLTEAEWLTGFRVAKNISRRMIYAHHDAEDCCSYLVSSVPRLWRYYDKSRGVPLHSWFHYCMCKHVRSWMHKRSKEITREPLCLEFSFEDDDKAPLMTQDRKREQLRVSRIQAKEDAEEVMKAARVASLSPAERRELDAAMRGEHGPGKARDNAKQRMRRKILWVLHLMENDTLCSATVPNPTTEQWRRMSIDMNRRMKDAHKRRQKEKKARKRRRQKPKPGEDGEGVQ